MEKKIFEKESEIFKLAVEMREKSDEVTHLKKGQIMNVRLSRHFIIIFIVICG